jgi:hypothetical protein
MPLWVDALATIIAAVMSSLFFVWVANRNRNRQWKTDVEARLVSMEKNIEKIHSRCELRETKVDAQYHELGIRQKDLLQVIGDLKEAIQPLKEMATTVAVISNSVEHIKDTISDKIAYIVERVDRNEERVDDLEEKFDKIKN